MGEEDVIIPIKVEVQDSDSTTSYLAKLKSHLESIQRTLSADSKGNTTLENVKNAAQQSIEHIEQLKAELGSITQESAENNEYVKELYNLYMQVKRGVGEYAGASDKTIASQKEMWQEARNYNESYQKESQERANTAVASIDAELKELYQLIRAYQVLAHNMSQTGDIRTLGAKVTDPNYQSDKDKLNDTGTPFQARAVIEAKKLEEERAKAEEERAKAAEEAEKAAQKATQAQIAELKKEGAAVKQSTAQYYYKLRSVKMLHHAIGEISNTLNKFGATSLRVASKSLSAYLKLIPGVSQLQKAMSKTHRTQKSFNNELKNTNKHSDGFNFSLKDLIKNLLKYTIGIRSLFVLFNKLRTAMVNGFNDMVKVYDPVNQQLSSISTSLLQMRNAVAAAVEPMLSVLAPALEKIANLVADVAYKVASFIAALTGKSMVIKATRAQVNYAKSLDKTAGSAKKARNELAAFDDLDVLQKQDDSGDGMPDAGAMFDEVPIDETMKDWAEKFKEFLDKLFAPIKNAWERARAYVINAFKYMCDQLKALWEDVARDFWRVWAEFKTEQLFYYAFLALGDIMLIIGELAAKIREAWNYAENGYRILASIRDIAFEIVYHFRQITAYTRDWVERELNLVPLFTAIADAMEKKVVPAVRRVLDLVVMIWNYGILELARDFINNNLPVLVQAVGYFIEGFGLIAKRVEMALETGTKIDGQIEYTRSRLQQLLDKVEHFSHIISESFKQMGEDFKNWADNLHLQPFFDSCIQFLTDIQPGFEALFGKFEIIDGKMEYTEGLVNRLWNEAILPFWKYIIEDGGPRLIEILGQIFGQYDEETGMGIDWEKFTETMKKFIDTLEPFFELTWEVLLQVIQDLGKAFDNFVNSGTLDWVVEHFKDWVDNANPEEIAHKLETFAIIFVEVIAAFNLANKVILPFVENWMTFHNFANNMAMNDTLKKISSDIAKLAGTEGGTTGLAGLTTKLSSAKTEFTTFKMVVQDATKVFSGSSPLVGGLMVIVGLFESLSSGMKMMNDGFSLGAEAAVIFGGALTTVGLILAGVAAWPAVIAGAIVVFIANLGAFGDDLLNWVLTTANDITEKVGEFFHNIGFYIGAAIHTLIANIGTLLKEKLGDLSKPENWEEFGINILKGIFAIFLLPFKLLEWIGTAIANLVAGFIEGLCTGFDMHSPSKLMEPYGENIFKGILEGIIQAVTGIGDWVKSHIFEPMIEGVKTAFGIVDGVATTFKEIGGNIIEGLKNGISDAWEKGKDFVGGIFQKVTDKAHETYDENSPSKVFQTIGGFLIEGMKIGIDNAMNLVSESLTIVFESIIKPFFAPETWAELGTGITSGLQLSFDNMFIMFEEALNTLWETYIVPFFSADKWMGELLTPFIEMLHTIWQEFLVMFDTATVELFTKIQTKWTTLSTWFTTTWNKYTLTWFNQLKVKWTTLDVWFNTTWNKAINKWFAETKVHWQNLIDWWDKSMKIWWINHVEPWFMEDKWLPQFTKIYQVAAKVFTAIKEFIAKKMEEAKQICIEACNSMAESLRGVISLIDELLTKLDQLASYDGGNINVNVAGNFPKLAQGAVIPPNREFMAVLGDQTSGTNIETPLNTMLEAFRSVMDEYSAPRGTQNATMEVDGETFARLMLPYVMNEMHRQGYNTEIIEGT